MRIRLEGISKKRSVGGKEWQATRCMNSHFKFEYLGHPGSSVG